MKSSGWGETQFRTFERSLDERIAFLAPAFCGQIYIAESESSPFSVYDLDGPKTAIEIHLPVAM